MSKLHQSMLYNDQRLPGLPFGQAKPGLSFPLGTGLVVLIILLVSAIFSFCYHWLRLRKAGSSLLPPHPSLLRQPTEPLSDICSCKSPPTKLSMLPCPPVVYMAGEEMPRFIAVPCTFEGGPCKASTVEDAQEKGLPKPVDDLKLDIRL